MSATVRAADGAFSLLPVILAGVSGAAMFNVAPLFLQTNAVRFRLDDRQIGWLMSAEIAGIAAASLAILFLMRRVHLRNVSMIGLIAIFTGNLSSLLVENFEVFLVLRFLVGLFGDGFAYVAAIVTLGRHPHAIRAFALLSFSNMCFGGLALALLPLFPATIVGLATIGLFGLISLVGMTVSAGYPYCVQAETGDRPIQSLGLSAMQVFGLFGLFAFSINLGAVWGYAERLGAVINLEPGISARLLSVSIVFQAMGSLLAVFLSQRARPLMVLTVVAVLQVTGLLIQAVATGPWAYLVGFSVWGASWNLGIANFLGLISSLPEGRRALSLAPGVEALGVAVGPMLVGSLLFFGTQVSVPLVAACAAVITLSIFLQIAASVSSSSHAT